MCVCVALTACFSMSEDGPEGVATGGSRGEDEGWKAGICGRRIMKSLCGHGMQMSRELIKPCAVCRTIGQVIRRAEALISVVKVCGNVCQRWKWLSLLGKPSCTSRGRRPRRIRPGSMQLSFHKFLQPTHPHNVYHCGLCCSASFEPKFLLMFIFIISEYRICLFFPFFYQLYPFGC